MKRTKRQKKSYVAIVRQYVKVDYLILPSVPNIYGYEKCFISLRDHETDTENKYFLDRCRAILKWGSTCRGNLQNISFVDNEVVFNIEFEDINDLNTFDKEFDISVSGATA